MADRRATSRRAPLVLLLALGASCHGGLIRSCTTSSAAGPTAGEPPVRVPFEVRDSSSNLMFVWRDRNGLHPASRIGDIPAEHRDVVRVDSLSIPPDERIDPSLVWVTDLRHAAGNGRYRVTVMAREEFEQGAGAGQGAVAFGSEPTPPPPSQPGGPAPPANGRPDVVIYGASWCGACHQAAAYLRSRGVAFVERDIERDPGALAEMQRLAAQQGVHPRGIPVIDVRGTLVEGFDQARLDQLLSQPPSAPPAGPGRPI